MHQCTDDPIVVQRLVVIMIVVMVVVMIAVVAALARLLQLMPPLFRLLAMLAVSADGFFQLLFGLVDPLLALSVVAIIGPHWHRTGDKAESYQSRN
jgi:hypothetical protein